MIRITPTIRKALVCLWYARDIAMQTVRHIDRLTGEEKELLSVDYRPTAIEVAAVASFILGALNESDMKLPRIKFKDLENCPMRKFEGYHFSLPEGEPRFYKMPPGVESFAALLALAQSHMEESHGGRELDGLYFVVSAISSLADGYVGLFDRARGLEDRIRAAAGVDVSHEQFVMEGAESEA